MGQAIAVAVLTGVLLTGARQAGTYAGEGLVKVILAFHHHVNKPVAHAVKVAAKHQVQAKQ